MSCTNISNKESLHKHTYVITHKVLYTRFGNWRVRHNRHSDQSFSHVGTWQLPSAGNDAEYCAQKCLHTQITTLEHGVMTLWIWREESDLNESYVNSSCFYDKMLTGLHQIFWIPLNSYTENNRLSFPVEFLSLIHHLIRLTALNRTAAALQRYK